MIKRTLYFGNPAYLKTTSPRPSPPREGAGQSEPNFVIYT